MEKNTIWFVTASVAFLLGWYYFFPPAKPPLDLPPAAVEKSFSGALQKPSGMEKPNAAPKSVPLLEAEKTLESNFARVVMTSKGAGARHWWVKEGHQQVDFISQGLPLGTFPEVNFEPLKSTMDELEWRGTLDSGVELRKRLVLASDAPFSDLTLQLFNPTRASVTLENFQVGWEGGLGTVESEKSENDSNTRVLAYPSTQKEVQVFKNAGTHQQIYHWAGIDNRYYLFAMFPEKDDFNVIAAEKSKANPGMIKLTAPPFILASNETKTFHMKIYAGPKGYTSLKSLNMGLEHSVDFGFFGFLGKAALKAMYAVHKVTKNYGTAIIVLTLGLQLIVFPLTLSSYKSMAIMKRLQPKMQEIQARYKDDAKRLSSEMMLLYKEAGTTPFSGCLPMLIQMPVFIAFFTMLRNSYELHGAPFMGWIHDLSKADPFYILPVLTGAIMFLQQKVSGSAPTDPTQKNMMMLMPVVFTFVFLKSPSGLALYWLTNSLVSMTIQFWAARKYSSVPTQTIVRR